MERIVRVATAGSVDDGKSTLIGRLLVATRSLFDDQLAELDAASARRGRGARDLAFATDGLREERERSVTIDAAYRPLRTSRRRFLLADAPGHAEYLRNMVTAASTADLLVVLVDAQRGPTVQTRRHLAVAAFLRVPVLLAVNKMDAVAYDRLAFEALSSELADLGRRLGVSRITALPVSAAYGDNVVEAAAAMPWHDGPTLLEALESFPLPPEEDGPPCLPVQVVLGGGIVLGTLRGGAIRVGDRLGSGTVERLWVAGEEATHADPGQAVAVRISPPSPLRGGGAGGEGSFDRRLGNDGEAAPSPLFLRRGDWLTSEAPARRLAATVFWMHPEPPRVGARYRLRQGPRAIGARVVRIVDVVDLTTGGRREGSPVGTNDLATVHFDLDEAVPLRLYAESRDLGSFVLSDPEGGVAAAGTVDRILPEGPRVLWLTGLSGAGKSSIAEAATERLRSAGASVAHLDGDALRAGLCAGLGFSPEDRMENVRRAAEAARLMVAQGHTTICSLISPLAAHRDLARRILGPAFVEVFVRCDLDECVRRDPKGLYARALAGAIPQFTGIGAPYDPPLAPDLVLDTQAEDLEACVERLIALTGVS